MCCLNAFPRRNFPLLVRLKRLAAPRCVFSLIFFAFAIPSSHEEPAKALTAELTETHACRYSIVLRPRDLVVPGGLVVISLRYLAAGGAAGTFDRPPPDCG